MGQFFEHYSKVIIGIIVAIVVVGIVFTFSIWFKSSSQKQFNAFDTIVEEQMNGISVAGSQDPSGD